MQLVVVRAGIELSRSSVTRIFTRDDDPAAAEHEIGAAPAEFVRRLFDNQDVLRVTLTRPTVIVVVARDANPDDQIWHVRELICQTYGASRRDLSGGWATTFDDSDI